MPAVRVSPGALRVPFLDLASAHAGIKDGLLAEIADLIDSGEFANGQHVAEFERAFAEFCGRPECVGVASGLDALRLGLLGAGLEPGEEVVVPANTFVATAEAVTQAGGRPVLVDASEVDYNVDVEATATAITPRTRFLLPVHLYGQLADLRALGELAGRYRIDVLEDACQAHGAERDGLRAGAAGTAAAFSFYPSKNLGAMGDAGAVVTDSAELATRVRALREHGQRAKYRHEWPGWTSRLDTIQALVLLHKLPRLEAANDERRAAAAYYLDRLGDVGDLRLPPTAPGSSPVWYLFVVRTAHPDELGRFLSDRGIGTGRHYPEPVHLTGAFGSLGYAPGTFPVAERLAREGLSLPLFPGITEQQLDAVVASVSDYFARG